ncbi:hypothetical protein ACPOL_6296 [Acidisarcina polymorpha]|uniref:Uncharacterized protein n=1 Tax=Acidisarcina polymorpha TaxID=2211140 RepID=A0A2Z5G8D0_9BACT|nr:hypothetical protein ACPOL_6296 [Acidisarcina polymorpha]
MSVIIILLLHSKRWMMQRREAANQNLPWSGCFLPSCVVGTLLHSKVHGH